MLLRNTCRLGRNAVILHIYIKLYWHIIVIYNLFLNKLDSGFTHTDYSKRRSIVGIGLASSKELFINTIAHEAKHILSHICQYYNVSEDGESAAYLLGYIIQLMYKLFKELL